MLFSVSFFIFFYLCTKVLMKRISLQLSFPSQRESHFVPNLIFGTPVLEGPIKSWFSVCLFAFPTAVRHFYQE